ncbi:MAG: T9SS type A sorting domain-containing protein [Bacteroidetes bacterium]|nr:T9SS type A sorting domain-containing protein [Bacteroidota bacterium]
MRVSCFVRVLPFVVAVGHPLAAQDYSAMSNQMQRWNHGVDPLPRSFSLPLQEGAQVPLTPQSMPNSPPNNPDIQVFDPSLYWQTENSIAVNFSNFDQLMVSTMGRIPGSNPVVHQTWAFSTDGGRTWPSSLQSESNPPSISNSYGDPVAFFDRSGRAYYATLGAPAGISITGTTDFGATWSPVTNADNALSTSDDKVHAAADYSGTYPDNIYAAWTDFNVPGYPVFFNRSTNQGLNWGNRQALPIGSNRGQGAHIAIGPNGEVYLTWAHYTTLTGVVEVGIGLAKSVDGGETFSAPVVAFPINGVRISNGFIPQINSRTMSYPYHDVDRSNGPRRGWIYVVTAELDTPSTGQADIYVRRSTDAGETWSGSIRVNEADVGPGKWQFMPSLAVDPTTGDITVSYYSQDSVGFNFMVNRCAAYSSDGGATWQNRIVSDVRTIWAPHIVPGGTGYNGDYYETAAAGGKAWPCWTDRRSGSSAAYSRAYVEIINYRVNAASEPVRNPVEFKLHQNYPNPFNPTTTIRYSLSSQERGGVRSLVTLKVFDVLGREVATLVDDVKEAGEHSVQFHANGLAGGVYFYQLSTNNFVQTMKLLLLR